VTELRPRTPALQLEQFFVSWAAQPSFSLAAHTLTDGEVSAAAAAAAMGGRQQQSAGGGGAAGLDLQRLQGLAVYWDSQQAFYLELTGQLLLTCRLLTCQACCQRFACVPACLVRAALPWPRRWCL
jgi:hypothetical protein